MARLNPLTAELLDVCAAEGVRIIDSGRGSKHPFIWFSVGDRKHKFVYPGSASDNRSIKNSVMQLRRIIRDMRSKLQ